MHKTKNKTLATWLALLGGPLGLHRFYLRGFGDIWGWLFPLPTALGLYGMERVQQFGQDDLWSWVLIPLLGLAIAASALTAIVYGLRSPEKWNAAFNTTGAPEAPAGSTNWFTVIGVAAALLLGTGVLMASLAFSFQRYFEYQADALAPKPLHASLMPENTVALITRHAGPNRALGVARLWSETPPGGS